MIQRKELQNASTETGISMEIVKDGEKIGGATFAEKWRTQKQSRNIKNYAFLATLWTRCIMLFHAPTQLYVFKQNIIPYVFQDHSPWFIYYINVLFWYIVILMVANWLCLILYDPSYPVTKEQPFIDVDNSETQLPEYFTSRIMQTTNRNRICTVSKEIYGACSDGRLPDTFCDKCKMFLPYRTHHCDVCKKCILKKDHHCYIVGNCVGFKNQRYFVVFTFYIALNASIAGCFTYIYFKNVVWSELDSWIDIVLPLAIVRYIIGSLNTLHFVLILQLYNELVFGILGYGYFIKQIALCIQGKTLYEKVKRIRVTNTNTVSQNMRSVFGECWVLNFLVPMTLIFRQKEDGTHWPGVKLHPNINKLKENGMVSPNGDVRIMMGHIV